MSSARQYGNNEMSANGTGGLHWEALDEDVSVEGFADGNWQTQGHSLAA